MRHFTEGELLDLAEGARPESSAGHLASCEACRRQLMDLRSAITAAAAVAVPEPSPFFWEHLSVRVREAVDGEVRHSGAGWLLRWPLWRALVPIGAVVMLALTGTIMWSPADKPSTATNASAESEMTGTAVDARDLAYSTNDPSFTLLADLTSDLDWDTASEAGLAPSTGAVDDVVTSLSGGERRELQRLLQEALRRPGA
jgi:hypothetical protein